MDLRWHRYRYYPYERELAFREINALLTPARIAEQENGVRVSGSRSTIENAERLTYFSAAIDGARAVPTEQARLECGNGNGVNRQSTRYSVHGLHEYKGKFNPQVAKALLNIFGAKSSQKAFDPFCGSGTSLVECAHLNIQAVGIDINPMAVFIANAKLGSLVIPAKKLLKDATEALSSARNSRRAYSTNDERGEYLSLWFTKEILRDIERLRLAVKSLQNKSVPVLLSIASNLLRDYSLQEPQDLRIRRRKSPLPETTFFDAFAKAAVNYCEKLKDAQETIGIRTMRSKALHADCRQLNGVIRKHTFDLALTSPPYATALPYIDTQRLSLIWLGLAPPGQMAILEAQLVGSREIRGESKKGLLSSLEANEAQLPDVEVNLCLRLQHALTKCDGFRRQAVPRLLYRYFAGMMAAFSGIRPLMKDDAPFGLIVGGNHTILGGTRYDIDTPRHLVNIAADIGWQHVETIPLQTYPRFGLHMSNSTTSEALVILRA